jgi:glycosyltransferase involved in cell wall biosynthesis
MIIVDAVYIHESGGKSLLEYFLREIFQANMHITLLADERLQTEIVNQFPAENIVRLKPSEKYRRKYYDKLPGSVTAIFCFANVPPPIFIKKIPVYIFFQNALLAASFFERNGYAWQKKIGFYCKQWYIRWHTAKQYTWIVQTEGMKKRIAGQFHISENKLNILPFFDTDFFSRPTQQPRKPNSFLYVADGVPQKNHLQLLAAWKILADQYHLFPVLTLTIPARFKALLEEVAKLTANGIQINNYTGCSKEQLRELYAANECLVFPSFVESFGLPLIEASMARCQIIAADLPYVHDVVVPNAVFDPHHASDMAAVIAQYLQQPKRQTPTLRVQNRVNELVNLIRM